MAIERMTKHQEYELVQAITAAVKMASAGMHPNDAIIKMATEKGYGKPHVNRMIEAFNVSKSIKHRKDAKGEEKAASFDIADPEVIFSKMYPESVQAPTEVKNAEWEPAGTNMEETRMFNLDTAPVISERRPEIHSYGQDGLDLLLKRACDEQHRQERTAEHIRQGMVDARECMQSELSKLAGYFRQIPHEPFDVFEKAALTIAGDSIKPVLELVWQMARRSEDRAEKHASATTEIKIGDRKPYELLNNILEARTKYAEATVKYAAAQQELTAYKADLNERMYALTKYSSGIGALTPFMVGTMLPKGIGESVGKGTSKPLSPADLTSVDFDAERKGIQTQSMLHDLMQNDEVLRRADPVHVVKAYNDLSTVAPRAVSSPMILRGLLRKAVESNAYDPYELANLVNMETGLKKRDVPDTESAPKA